MAEEIKNDFSGGLNLDDSPYKINPNEYFDALNITKNSIDESHDKVVTNIIGNRVVSYVYQAGGLPTTIGAKAHPLRGTIIEFAFHPAGYHSIIEFNSLARVRTKIFENLTDSGGIDVLGFLKNKKITSINILPRDIEGDLLFFIDSLGRPTGLNITKFKAGVYTPVTRDILDVAKCPPLSPPSNVVYAPNNTIRSNNLRKREFRFKYRYAGGTDFYRTTCSPLSIIPIKINILDDVYTSVITNNNAIQMSVIAGNRDFTKIEVLMSYVEASNDWSIFYLVATLSQVGVNAGITIPFTFYNDGVYAPIDPNQSIQLFDSVPDKANCQELLNGNVLAYAGITEGYDKNTDPNVTLGLSVSTYTATQNTPVGSLDAVVTILNDNSTSQTFKIVFSGLPPIGAVVTLLMRRDALVFTAATFTMSSITSSDVATNLLNSLNSIGQAGSSVGGAASVSGSTLTILGNGPFEQKRVFSSLTIVVAASVFGSPSLPVFPFSETKRIGLAYFDSKGKTNGVLYYDQFTTPSYNENGSQQVLLPNLNAKITHIPPIWAASFQWLMTKSNTNYIFWQTVNVLGETDFLYFNVTNFQTTQKKFPITTKVLSYSFKEGDRFRIIKRVSDGFIFDDTYDAQIEGLVVDPLINGSLTPSLGQYLKIKRFAPITTMDFSTSRFNIQIYTPSQQSALGDAKTQTFFEISREYRIGNAGLATRFHLGEVTDQNITTSIPAEFNFRSGDAYFRLRKTSLSENGLALFNVIDRNILDSYISAVNNIDGRPSIIDENARKSYFPTLIRFGQAYETNTNINGLNRFYSNNFDNYDLSFGDVMRIKVRARTLKVFQKFNVGIVPLYSQINKGADGTAINVVTDKLLNPIQYRVAGIGIGENAESLVSNRFADYFTDSVKGLICRDSDNGTESLSSLFKASAFGTQQVPLRVGDYKIYGAYNPVINNYIIALEATLTQPPYTLLFNEDTNRFDTFVSYFPEMMTTLSVLLCTFKDGQLWTHDGTVYNNFFGVQYNSEIQAIFNNTSTMVKSFEAVEINSNSAWGVPEIETSLKSYGTTPQQSNLIPQDFTLVEGKYVSALLRDSNSIGGINGGDQLKGNWIKMRFRNTVSNILVSLNNIKLRVIDSSLNNK